MYLSLSIYFLIYLKENGDYTYQWQVCIIHYDGLVVVLGWVASTSSYACVDYADIILSITGARKH